MSRWNLGVREEQFPLSSRDNWRGDSRKLIRTVSAWNMGLSITPGCAQSVDTVANLLFSSQPTYSYCEQFPEAWSRIFVMEPDTLGLASALALLGIYNATSQISSSWLVLVCCTICAADHQNLEQCVIDAVSVSTLQR